MTEKPRGTSGDPHGTSPSRDTESALQQELKRESAEGAGTIGDMSENRNLGGSSTWETLPVSGSQTENATSADSGAEISHHVKDEVSDRLHRRGVHLTGDESDEDLVNLLDVVERFESAVERRGGDLMVDEAPDGSATQPDDPRFVLPRREAGETIAALIERIETAIDVTTLRRRGG